MNEIDFKTATKEVLLAGVKACVKNGNSLYIQGKSMGSIKKYGLACSLLVLSVEEYVKCVILTAGFFNVKTDTDISLFFRDHKTKHRHAAEMQSLLNSIHNVLDSFKKMIKESKHVALDISIILLLHNVLEKFLKSERDFEKWWKDADKLKKTGFYVDYTDGNWQLPSSVNFETYQRAVRIATPFAETLEVLTQINPEDYKIIE